MKWDGGNTSAGLCYAIMCDGRCIYHCSQTQGLAQINFEPDSLVEGSSPGWDAVAAVLKLLNLKDCVSNG